MSFWTLWRKLNPFSKLFDTLQQLDSQLDEIVGECLQKSRELAIKSALDDNEIELLRSELNECRKAMLEAEALLTGYLGSDNNYAKIALAKLSNRIKTLDSKIQLN